MCKLIYFFSCHLFCLHVGCCVYSIYILMTFSSFSLCSVCMAFVIQMKFRMTWSFTGNRKLTFGRNWHVFPEAFWECQPLVPHLRGLSRWLVVHWKKGGHNCQDLQWMDCSSCTDFDFDHGLDWKWTLYTVQCKLLTSFGTLMLNLMLWKRQLTVKWTFANEKYWLMIWWFVHCVREIL